MKIYIPQRLYIMGEPVPHTIPLEITYMDKSKTLVINGYQFTPEESSGIIGYFKGLEESK